MNWSMIRMRIFINHRRIIMYGHNKRVPKPELELSDKELLDSVYNETIDEAHSALFPKTATTQNKTSISP